VQSAPPFGYNRLLNKVPGSKLNSHRRLTAASSLGAVVLCAAAPENAAAAVSPPDMIRAVTGFVLLLALAYIAGHPRLVQAEHRLALNPLVTSGLVFVFLGTLASERNVGVLTDAPLAAISPVIPLGLGWIGFRTGLRFDHRLIGTPVSQAGIFLATILPIGFSLAGCMIGAWLVNPSAITDPLWVRDCLLIGLAGAMTSLPAIKILIGRWPRDFSRERLESFVKLEHVAGISGLMLMAIFFRPQGDVVGWRLPGNGWLLITLGSGCAMGLLAYALLRTSPKGPPFFIILLGVICMSAGMASFLRLSVLAVCFLSGAVVANMPGTFNEEVCAVLKRLERPVFLVLMLVAGAIWQPLDWHGWVLAGIFLISRICGKWTAMRFSSRFLPEELNAAERRALTLAPIGPFAIAVILSARDLYPGARTSWMLTAAISGAVISELLFQWFLRREEPAPAEVAA
jgi:hypothetical protein